MTPLAPVNINDKLGPEKLPVGWPWKFFLFSVLTLVTMVVLYFGLEFGYKVFLNSRINSLNQSIDELSQTIPKDQQDSLIRFYSQIVNLQNLLKNHTITSKVFTFLQNNTNKSIFYTFYDLKVPERRLNLEGTANNYEIFAQQLEAFNQSPAVESLVVNESSAVEGRVRFKLFLILKNEIFR